MGTLCSVIAADVRRGDKQIERPGLTGYFLHVEHGARFQDAVDIQISERAGIDVHIDLQNIFDRPRHVLQRAVYFVSAQMVVRAALKDAKQ